MAGANSRWGAQSHRGTGCWNADGGWAPANALEDELDLGALMWAESDRSTFRKERKILMQILMEENPANIPEYVLQESSLVYSAEANAIYRYVCNNVQEDISSEQLEQVIYDASGDPLDANAVSRAAQRIVEALG